ncbi:MAG TPA: Na/Pi cotransporter family protein [bacterium]|nr:Na/Pi cotransporter family protein [bacterium]
MRSFNHLRSAAFGLLVVLLLAPCVSAETVQLGFAKSIDGDDISGNGQIGVAGEPLRRPLRVHAADSLGRSMTGIALSFRVIEAGMGIESASGYPVIETYQARTDGEGNATASLKFGSRNGVFHVLCSADSLEGRPLVFTVKAYRQHWLVFMLVGISGGLAIFLFGIRFGGRGLQKAAGKSLRDTVIRLTSNRWVGLVTGVILTVIIQSSSATTAMLVSFANAGIIGLKQALGVILGSDIGTTLTVQLIAFRLFDYALLVVVLGFVLFSSKIERYSRVGQIIMGFGLLFFGMTIMSGAVEPAKDHPTFVHFMLGVERNPLLAIVISALFTALIHGSAATIGLVLTLAFEGVISLKGAIPLVLGANVGTCATALMASVGSNAEGKRIAWAHTFFKIAAVAMIFPFLKPFTRLVAGTSPNLTRQIANAHTLFNVGAALVFLPLVAPWGRLFRFLVKEEEVDVEVFRPAYLDRGVLDTPSLALGQATRETLRMADITYGIFSKSIDVFLNDNEGLREKLIEDDDKIDMLEEAITPYLSQLPSKEMSEEEGQRAVSLLFTVKNLELIGDIVSKSLMDLALKKIMVSPRFSKEALDRIRQYHQEIEKTFQMAIDAFASQDKKLAEEVVERKSEMNILERQLHKEHLALLQGSKEDVMETSTVYLDVISDLKRINSYASGIAYAVLGRL